MKLLLKLISAILGKSKTTTPPAKKKEVKEVVEKKAEIDCSATTGIEEIPEIEKDVIDEEPSAEEQYKSEEHFLPEGEYFEGPTTKEWAFGHHTAGWHNPYKVIDSWGRDNRGAVATEYVLGGQKITDNNAEFDGVLVKAFPEGGWGWHLGTGRGKLHSNSIGIELNNFGYLTKGGYYKRIGGKRTWIERDEGKFYTYVGTEAHPDQVIELEQEFRGYKYWHNYSDAQISKLKVWLKTIQSRYGINPKKGLVELIKKKGVFEAFDFCDVQYVTKNPGFYLHTNVQRGKVDLYPHPKLVKMLLSL